VGDLSIVEQQRLEIIKALARGARVLILDEPTALLAPAEIADLLRWVRAFADAGGSVVLVTHKLREALGVADAVTVLRRGELAFSGAAAETSEEALAQAAFPEMTSAPAVEIGEPGEVVATAHDLDVLDDRGSRRVRGVSLQLRRREVVGLAAVEGSGHRELLLALAGVRRPSGGELTLPARIGFVPADRMREALIADFSLTENVALHGLHRRRGVMPWKAIETAAADLVSRFGIVAPSPRTPVRQLSGGNQQRLVLAREIAEDVELLIADNPTRGLDVRATDFVHDELRKAARSGSAVLVHSSDLDEVLSLATRVLVMFHGEVRETAADRDVVGKAILGAASGAETT
jgi:simple sugar transport system ATP-binding protein